MNFIYLKTQKKILKKFNQINIQLINYICYLIKNSKGKINFIQLLSLKMIWFLI